MIVDSRVVGLVNCFETQIRFDQNFSQMFQDMRTGAQGN